MHDFSLPRANSHHSGIKELKRKHDSWNVDWDMGRGRKPLYSFVSANVEKDEDGTFCFNHMAVSITHPSVEPMFFFNKENYNNWIMDEFIYCRNHDVTERYLACIYYNAVRLDCEQSLMVIRQYSSMEDLDNMELPTHLENLYKQWKGMSKICLKHGCRKWDVLIHWVGEKCWFGKGWSGVLKELDICVGDVIAMNMAHELPEIVLLFIFNEKDVEAEKKEGDRNGRRSFYKIFFEGPLKLGYITIQRFLGQETEKHLLGVEHIIINGILWDVRYDAKLRILYELEQLIKYFGLVGNDMILFSFGGNGEFCGRIFMCEGTEITRSTAESNRRRKPSANFFLFEDNVTDSPPGIEQNVEIVDLSIEMEVEGYDNLAQDNAGIQNMQLMENNNPHDAQVGMNLQFSKLLAGSLLNSKFHGAHIPRTIRFRDQMWKSGDMVKFRTGQGVWDIKIVLNGIVARFSRGWSKFVKDLDLKEMTICASHYSKIVLFQILTLKSILPISNYPPYIS
ncbi:hypothetical protein AgCh_031441 [Apium graveolens]